MTRREFYKKLHPVVMWRLDEYKRHGWMAVSDAFYICCLKEMDFRLDYEADDQVDDIPEFDEMTPGFFLNEFSQIVEDWDEAAELLLPGDGGYEMYTRMLDAIRKAWNERGADEKKD